MSRGRSLLAGLLCAFLLSWGAPAFAVIGAPVVIAPYTVGKASNSALATTVDAPIGSLILIFADGWVATNDTISSCSDSAGNPYTKAVEKTQSGFYNSTIFYSQNTAIDLPIAGSVKCTSTSGSSITLVAWVVSGANGGLDLHPSASATGTTVSLASGTFCNANEIIVANNMLTNTIGTWTESSGFTKLTGGGSGDFSAMAYKIVSATTPVTYAPSWTTAGNSIDLTMASFVITSGSCAGGATGAGSLTTFGVGQ